MGRLSKQKQHLRAARAAGIQSTKAAAERHNHQLAVDKEVLLLEHDLPPFLGALSEDSGFSDDGKDEEEVEVNGEEEVEEELPMDLDMSVIQKMMERDHTQEEYIRYHRGPKEHRQTTWRKARYGIELQEAAKNSHKITSFLKLLSQYLIILYGGIIQRA